MVVSIGAVASASQGVFYYEKDGYYARDDPAHREASSWSGKGAEKLGLEGPVDPDLFPERSRRRGARRQRSQAWTQGARWGPAPPARAGPHLLGPQVRLTRGPGRRRWTGH